MVNATQERAHHNDLMGVPDLITETVSLEKKIAGEIPTHYMAQM